MGIIKEHLEFAGIRQRSPSLTLFLPLTLSTANYTLALMIELCRGAPPDTCDFCQFKSTNGSSMPFQTVQTFGHTDDIPLMVLIYRIIVCPNRPCPLKC